jgi:hypothetical protein
MRIRNCNEIRQELDEVLPRDNYSVAAADHLEECLECREFQEKQIKLHGIVGSLGTVEAPADFDFRLRARLANEAGNSTYHLNAVHWSLASRSVVAVAALVLFFGTFIGVRRLINNKGAGAVAESEPNVRVVTTPEPAVKAENVEAAIPVHSEDSTGSAHLEPPGKASVATIRVPKRSVVSQDFSSERAPRFLAGPSMEGGAFPTFPIDAPGEALRLSLDDGQGNARTISFPTVSFGSQRVLAAGGKHQAPKTVW